MLSGIKMGKKKKKAKPTVPSSSGLVAEPPAGSTTSPDTSASVTQRDNLSIADRLRQSLDSSGVPGHGAGPGTGPGPGPGPAMSTSSTQNQSLLRQLERRGRIESARSIPDAHAHAHSGEASIVVELPLGPANTQTKSKKEEDMTVHELVAQERRENQQHVSWDEHMTRNLARLGKKRRRDDKTEGGSDEEVEKLKRLLPGAGPEAKEGSAKQQRATDKAQQRDRHRLMNAKAQEDKVTSKCSWWMESSSFRKHRLLALGNHVSLVMAPPNASLVEGNHFYLVPFKHAPSFVDVAEDADIWQEVQHFQTSLQNMYAREGKSVVLVETVLANKGFWQTKLEVVPVPFGVLQEAPLFFQSAMREQTEEWGTHNKLLKITSQKPLSIVVPKGFPYFAVEWGNISTAPNNTGLAQIIESEDFRHDFGLDTLAGMLELDPIRFQRKRSFSYEDERQQIAAFLKKWDNVDWTKALDGPK